MMNSMGFEGPVGYGNDVMRLANLPGVDRILQRNLQLQDNQAGHQQDLQNDSFGFQGQQNALQRAMSEAMQGRQLGFQGEQAAADRGFSGQQNELQRALQERMQGNQFNFQGTQAGLDRAQAKDLQSAALSNQLSIAGMPIAFAREKFNSIFPLVSGAIGGMGGGASAGGGGGGQAQMAPGSVYTPGMIDQSVNSMKAGNAQQSATMQRKNASDNAAGGFGSNSPLLQAMNNQAQMGAMQANTSGERDLRLGAATANAKQGLGAAQANNQARIGFEQNAIDARRTDVNARTSLLQALAGMM